MAVTIRATVSGLEDAIRGIGRIRKQISDFAPFWRSIAVPIVKDKLREIFLKEGPGWAPLSPATIRMRKYPDLPILQQTGALMASVVDHPVLEVTRRQLLYTTNNPYAAEHEFGTPKIPARPFLGPARRAVMEEIRGAYLDYLFETGAQDRRR